MRPEWLKIMDIFRSQRLDEVVYQPRRRSLALAYKTYVMHHPSPDTPVLDLLPHVVDIAGLAPFREIIGAPEGTQMSDESFTAAFAQLPALLEELEWRKKLDDELIALIQVPACLSSNVSGALVLASDGTTATESCQTNTDKLRLACALFRAANGTFSYPEVFSVSMRWQSLFVPRNEDRAEPIERRFSINFLAEAPYIVRACGLDPNVATADDMDRRNARLRCLWDDPHSRNVVMGWRNVVRLLLHLDAYGTLSIAY